MNRLRVPDNWAQLTFCKIRYIINTVYNWVMEMNWGIGFKQGAQCKMFEQKNVMTSLLQCCLGMGVLGVILFCLTDSPYIQFCILGILGILILTFAGMFIYFSLSQPKLLQSERHLEKMAVM